MSDNIAITPGVGALVATDDINGVQYQKVLVSPMSLIKNVDFIDETHFYVGETFPGNATSAATWRISYSVLSSNGNLVMKYADLGNFTQIWDNRLSLSYT